MKPEKAYIIVINDPRSIEYAAHAVKSCNDLGIEYQIIQGLQDLDLVQAWAHVKEGIIIRAEMDDKAACASATHALVWQRIAENKECAIILEHDAVMLHKLEIDIPDNEIVCLGYKYPNITAYDHERAGPSVRLIPIGMHGGAHAYAITYVTAHMLLKELYEKGAEEAVDNRYFMRNYPELVSKVPISICDPISAMGWIRESTIWDGDADLQNFTFLRSFIINSDFEALFDEDK
jgi:hypothetical protein